MFKLRDAGFQPEPKNFTNSRVLAIQNTFHIKFELGVNLQTCTILVKVFNLADRVIQTLVNSIHSNLVTLDEVYNSKS